MEVDYDPDQDTVLLKIGREGSALPQRDVLWLIEDLLNAVDEQNLVSAAGRQLGPRDARTLALLSQVSQGVEGVA
jgi:hypothetical protein